MQAKPDTHPELHRKLAWYHLRKWLQPNRLIPVPTSSTSNRITAAPNPEPGGFLDVLKLLWKGGKRPYEMQAPYRYSSHLTNELITVPAGYRTDFASVPRFFWRILPPHGEYVPASVVHDWLCALRGETGIDSKTTHKVFLEAMEILCVPAWKRWTMYQAVKWFGPRFKSKTLTP